MCEKRKKNNKKKKTKKLSQFLKSHVSGTLEAISLKFGMWSAEGGGSVHSKNRLVSSRQHRATEAQKLHFLSSCQYTHGCYAPASWAAENCVFFLPVNILTGVTRRLLGPHDTLPCVLIHIFIACLLFPTG